MDIKTQNTSFEIKTDDNFHVQFDNESTFEHFIGQFQLVCPKLLCIVDGTILHYYDKLSSLPNNIRFDYKQRRGKLTEYYFRDIDNDSLYCVFGREAAKIFYPRIDLVDPGGISESTNKPPTNKPPTNKPTTSTLTTNKPPTNITTTNRPPTTSTSTMPSNKPTTSTSTSTMTANKPPTNITTPNRPPTSTITTNKPPTTTPNITTPNKPPTSTPIIQSLKTKTVSDNIIIDKGNRLIFTTTDYPVEIITRCCK